MADASQTTDNWPLRQAQHDARRTPVLLALGNLMAERQKAEEVIEQYHGIESSPHYQPWVDRARLLRRAETALMEVLNDDE